MAEEKKEQPHVIFVWHYGSYISGDLNQVLHLPHVITKEDNLDVLDPALPLTHAKQNKHTKGCNNKSQDFLLYRNVSLTWTGLGNPALDALGG